MFVRAISGHYASLGVGKCIDRRGTLCSVEYFDSPTTDVVVHTIEKDLIARVALAKHTRVYHFDEAARTWEIGRFLEDHGDSQLVQFPNAKLVYLKLESIFVRWSRPILDPTPLLANLINETPRFSDGRTTFVRSQMRQRAAAIGISALLSCAIELEAHQIEVVRRILQDPVQRYLLADEVGLGKTIEAGVLIRQCILDTEENCVVLVIVPGALVDQWRAELSNKFFLNRCLDRTIHVLAFDEGERIRAILPATTMLVIDEAHHLTERLAEGVNRNYTDIAAASPAIDRVLLLSATPALHNERGFLQMLHLLDPATYPLCAEESFRRKIQSRQVLAEIVAGLRPENAPYLDYTIDQLASLFPDDELLQEHAAKLRTVIATMPESDDPVLVEAIGWLQAHLSEVYRLDRRILRHRRRSIGGLTPDRSGAEIVRYRSGDRAGLTAALNDWRFDEAVKLDAAGSEDLWDDCVHAFWQVLDRASQYPDPGAKADVFRVVQARMMGDPERLAALSRFLGRPGLFDDRVRALIGALIQLVHTQAQCVIFCSDVATANSLARKISEELGVAVDRHDPDNNAWMAFADGIDHPVLVCDRRAEEGLNLQGGKKVVVHYDAPLNPNRIEQRLGRTDRYGSGDAVRSLVLACEDDPFEMAWISYLNSALRVFDRSVASLQYLIEETVHRIARDLFTDGPDALTDLTTRSVGEQGLIDREIKAIDQQDALDALGAPPTDLVDALSEIDDDWQALTRDTAIWLEQTLQLRRIDESRLITGAGTGTSPPFRYVYSRSNPETLVAMSDFVTRCATALDHTRGSRFERTITTIPYTFRRRTALSRAARAHDVGLMRYGDGLISGMTALTDADDRGRSFAMWRFAPDHVGDPIVEFYFRFDFVLESDLAKAAGVLADHDRGRSAAHAAVRRRGDMALAPFYQTIWLDRELMLVRDEALLVCLGRDYAVRPDGSGAVDLNLNAQRWKRLRQLQVPELDYWAELCDKARTVAESALRTDLLVIATLEEAGQRAAQVDRGRIGQLRARAQLGVAAADRVELAFEEQLAAALRDGIRVPHVRLDTIGAIFVSGSRSVTDRISGGF